MATSTETLLTEFGEKYQYRITIDHKCVYRVYKDNELVQTFTNPDHLIMYLGNVLHNAMWRAEKGGA